MAEESTGVAAIASGRLSRKVLAGLALAVALASLGFLFVFIETYRHELGSERGNASNQVNRLLQVSLENAMLKRDLPGLEDIISRLGQQPGITGVLILNPAREVRFASDKSKLATKLSFSDLGCANCAEAGLRSLERSTQLVTLDGGEEVLRSVNPIPNRQPCETCHGAVSKSPINGVLIVDHEAHGIHAAAMRAAAAMSGAGLLVLLAGLGTVWLFMKRKVLTPIMALDEASRALAAGDLRSRVAVDQADTDELAALCRNFNGMADRIERGVQEAREQEAFLKTLIDTVPDAVRVLDEDYTVVMANQAYARQSGAELSTLVGVPCYLAHGRSERCPPTLEICPFHAITEDCTPIKYIHEHVRANNGPIQVEATAARLSVERNGRRRTLIIEVIRDFEQQIRLSHEQRLSEIGQLAAGVAHEIYNPLTSVRLGLRAIQRRTMSHSALNQEASDYLAMIDGEIDKCISVTKRLLDLSQVPSAKLQLVSLSTIIPEVVALLRFEAETHGIAVDVDFGGEDLRVLATDAELRMLVLNLVQNAFHAMSKGGRLTITGQYEADTIVVRFADTGVGIEPDVLPRIFEPFFSRRADGVSGTGLGLTISKAIASRYKIHIDVASSPGKGTTFKLAFPRPECHDSIA